MEADNFSKIASRIIPNNTCRAIHRIKPILAPLLIGFFIGILLQLILRPSLELKRQWNPNPYSLYELSTHQTYSEPTGEDQTVAGEDLLSQQHSLHEEYHMQSDGEARVINQQVSIFCIVICTQRDIKKQATLIEAIKFTWGARCSNIVVLSHFNESLGVRGINVVTFPELNRGMPWMWGRTKAIFNYTHHMHRNEAEWFLRAEDSNYVVMENLRLFLKDEQFLTPVHFGYRMKPYAKQGYMNGGAGYAISREGLELLVVHGIYNKSMCRPDSEGAEDVEMGKCLENVGVRAGDSRDNLQRHRFFPFAPINHLVDTNRNQTLEFWKQIYYPHSSGMDCCSDRAISFHSLSHGNIYAMEYLLYHLRPYGISQSLNATRKRLPFDPTNVTKV